MALNDQQTRFMEYLKTQLLNPARPLPFDELEIKASMFADLMFSGELSGTEIEQVIQELTRENIVEMPLGGSLIDQRTFRPWIAERRKATQTPRWDAYKQLLIRRRWEANVISKLDAQTDEMVELLGDPTQANSSWPRRGLLMGEVQSGKTATYLGILNKALDYGYRVIIVIGGHTEDLRQQTQSRFDTDLLGIDSETLEDSISNAAIRTVGVGQLSGLRAHLMTTVRRDFSRSRRVSGITWVDGELPTVFVTKKTPSLLDNIRTYIGAQAEGGRLDIPLIVIDDESDWGTPNTRNESDPTSVNRAIRALLDVSTRSSYLAITATPFANIFMDDRATYRFVEEQGDKKLGNDEVADSPGTLLQDLFPSDYIRVMFPPTTYFGMGTYFSGDENKAICTEVEDCLQVIPIKHKSGHSVSALPESMKTAMVEFLLGTSVRRIRDQETKPASMLINVSRFKSVERQVADLADEFLRDTRDVILGEFLRDSALRSDRAERIHEVWRAQFVNVTDVTWEQVSKELVKIVPEFRVDLINGDTARERSIRRKQLTPAQRKADDLVPKIAVGGDILSRGLTLDGLQVSYFVREPRTMDTLMQMGRWFGYRPHFDDLVRVWMPEVTQANFTYSAEVTEELRETLLDMKGRGLTPRDFGLRVRVHPDSVNIVAANKGRNTEIVDIGPVVWEKRLAEAYDLTGDADVDQANQEAVERLVGRLGGHCCGRTSGNFPIWRDVPLDVILDFFHAFEGDSGSQWFGRGPDGVLPITDAFGVTPGNDHWDVVLVDSGKGESHSFGVLEVKMSVRNKMGRSLSNGHIRLDRRRVSSATDVIGSLIKSERDALKAEPLLSLDGKLLSSQAQVLRTIRHPILMIYAVTAAEPKTPDDPDFEPVGEGLTRIAVAIAFPSMDPEEFVLARSHSKKYQVNPVYWRAYNGYVEDAGDDEWDGDDS